ncbi:MAG: 50S ribosomal protein L22 [Candidatus Altiarchaeota archaeon]|nr:50S ribosomal protein L22 [Candidatus Altiarchaeota archaeon]
MELKYAFKPEQENKTAKAIGRDVNMSFKKAAMVCDSVRGMNVEKAVKLLERVAAIEEPVPFRKYQRGASHRAGKGVAKYPKKAALEILKVLKNLQANAEYKGLEAERLEIIGIQANMGPARRRRKPKGRWKSWETRYVTIQAIAREK